MGGQSKDRYIILGNGGPGCSDYLLPVSRMIADGYNVVRFEERGCGRSAPDSNYSIETTVSDTEVIRQYYNIVSWTVGGHSWGANMALFLCGAMDIRPLWPLEQVQALLGNSELVIVPGAQHCIWMTHYEEMKVVVRRFLRVEG